MHRYFDRNAWTILEVRCQIPNTICMCHYYISVYLDGASLLNMTTTCGFCGWNDNSGLDFIIKDLPSVLILIIADQMLNDSQCCS